MHDIVIRGGTIVDGTGRPAFVGDVAIDGDKIVSVGGKAGPARRDIDAAGQWLLPGMIDDPGSFSGKEISPIPQRGPDPSKRISLAIFIKLTAKVLSIPDASTNAS